MTIYNIIITILDQLINVSPLIAFYLVYSPRYSCIVYGDRFKGLFYFIHLALLFLLTAFLGRAIKVNLFEFSIGDFKYGIGFFFALGYYKLLSYAKSYFDITREEKIQKEILLEISNFERLDDNEKLYHFDSYQDEYDEINPIKYLITEGNWAWYLNYHEYKRWRVLKEIIWKFKEIKR